MVRIWYTITLISGKKWTERESNVFDVSNFQIGRTIFGASIFFNYIPSVYLWVIYAHNVETKVIMKSFDY